MERRGNKKSTRISRQALGAQKISQLYYMRRKEISQMIKATSQSVCSGITGCQVELLGSGAELAKEVLVSITKEAIKQAEEKR